MRLTEKILEDICDDEVGDMHYTRIFKSLQYLCKTAIVVASDDDQDFRCFNQFFFLKPYTEYEFNLWFGSQAFFFEECDKENKPYMIFDLLLERSAFVQIFVSLCLELTFYITEHGQLKIFLEDLNAYIESDVPKKNILLVKNELPIYFHKLLAKNIYK